MLFEILLKFTSNAKLKKMFSAHKNISAGPSEQSLLRNEKVTTNKTIIRNGKYIYIIFILLLNILKTAIKLSKKYNHYII